MSGPDYPDGWEIPSQRFLRQEPLLFGVPRKQGALMLLLWFGVFSAVSNTVGIIAAVPVSILTAGCVLGALRWLYARDNHWWDHMTGHVFPPNRYTGA